MHNNHMHADSKKRRSSLAMLFAAGDVRRYAIKSCQDYWHITKEKLMKLINVALICISTLPMLSHADEDKTEKLRESTLSFVAEYPDGTKENIIMEYEGIFHRKQWQTGKVAKLEHKGGLRVDWHPVDDRKCHWTFDTYVKRRAFFVSRSGIQAPISDFEQIFKASDYDDIGPDNFIESLTYHRTCESSMGTYNQQVTAQQNMLTNGFDKIVKGDQAKAIAYLKDLVKAVKLEQK